MWASPLTELYPPVLSVMAGFRVDGDPYCVPKIEDPPPLDDATATTTRDEFPKIRLWSTQKAVGIVISRSQPGISFMWPFLSWEGYFYRMIQGGLHLITSRLFLKAVKAR